MSHPYQLLFSLLPFLFLSKTNGNPVNSIIPHCPFTTCGELSIRYPFWLSSENPDYCGYPSFHFTCENKKKLIFHLPNDNYYVTNINYSQNTLTLVDIDVVRQRCPRALHNVTLEPAMHLNYTALDENLTFYFNCKPYHSSAMPLSCLSNGGNHSYMFREGEIPEFDWYEYCEDFVVAPVLKHEVKVLTGDAFGAVLERGFELHWTSVRDCLACEESEGYCGKNKSNDQFICFCKDGPQARSCDHGTSVGVAVLFLAGIFLFFFSHKATYKPIFFWNKKSKDNHDVEKFLKNYGSLIPNRYQYSDLKKMTNSFKDKLGQGGYGGVFKGKLYDGRLIAVKVLSNSKCNGEDFINEVASIGRTYHVNIVALLGFCSEGSKRALIYEFMPNGSLEKFIYAEKPRETNPLGWEKLYEIAIGIARGLEYLHRGCSTRIVHLDIKPHNILLDEDFRPKISDFGLAKICPAKESIISMTGARGTVGYIAPEVFCRNFGRVSYKSDVYSYGMMVLEMVGGRRNIEANVENTSEVYFPHWIYQHLDLEGHLGLHGVTVREEEDIVRKMIIVGLWCIQTDPADRPSTSRVVEMLEGSVESLSIPPKPFLTSPSRTCQGPSSS